ncbi:lytic polysaccharide monooxygenase [Streptomyces phyllanthi]|uniref:Lytic polysaccharide monooxygenase n=1 Tax=Streptomyces phyllanthi TaxID=1803180 RepID=A0A5N8WCN6_9ACTN|nr:lytic polysaccharide monooxygenase [Streptomyces phyllanthi]MPY44902.1 lytic polysaccharide monooxygenase [Streptomyces phyllanthi]
MDRTHRMRTRVTSRGPARRAALAAAATAAAPVLLTTWAAPPALAHGAPTDPVSRVSACSPEGGERARSAACRAAVAANGAPFTAWDNLRVAGVGGRDRQVVPDGKLCSGGLPAYRGLDLARADWPSTRLSPGAKLNLTYRSTIPHTGTFKLYLTKPGYDPAEPLTWSDLPAKPFAEITDPPLRDGSYRFSARLPSDRSGHHVLYTIWQNTSTVDTYYSCSDVVFPKAAEGGGTSRQKDTDRGGDRDGEGNGDKASGKGSGATGSPKPSGTADGTAAGDTASGGTGSGETADGQAGNAGSAERTAVPGSPVSRATSESGASLPLIAAGGAAAMVLAAGAALTVRRLRSR